MFYSILFGYHFWIIQYFYLDPSQVYSLPWCITLPDPKTAFYHFFYLIIGLILELIKPRYYNNLHTRPFVYTACWNPVLKIPGKVQVACVSSPKHSFCDHEHIGLFNLKNVGSKIIQKRHFTH